MDAAATQPGPAAGLAADKLAELYPGLAAVAGPVTGGEPAGPVVLANRRGRLVVRFGEIVLKMHASGVDGADLAARLAVAADPRMSHVMLAPLPIPGAVVGTMIARVGDRFVSAWPVGTPLRPGPGDAGGMSREGRERDGGGSGSGGGDGGETGGPRLGEADDQAGGGAASQDWDGWEDGVPWEQAASLLAQLHAVPTPASVAAPAGWADVPPAGVCRRLERAVGRLAGIDDPAAHDVRRAYAALPGWVRQTPARPGGVSTLIHGDWHLGQLVHLGGRGWRVVDVDDLGFGDPAWDLARPAACFAAGLLGPQAWQRFLGGYQAAGGAAVPRHGQVWEVLDTPARALAVHCAATEVADAAAAREPLDDAGQAFVECCRRMTRLRSPYADLVGTLRAALPGVPIHRSAGPT